MLENIYLDIRRTWRYDPFRMDLLPENLVIEVKKSFDSRIIKLINSNWNRILY